MNGIGKASALMMTLFIHASFATGSEAFVPGGTLDPTTIPQFHERLTIPPVMPKTATLKEKLCNEQKKNGTVAKACRNGEKKSEVDYYEIAARPFRQQVLPSGYPSTTVWGYGSAADPKTFNYPAYTIEAQVDRPVRVKWINDLKYPDGSFIPHLLPVDQTLTWANPPQDCLDGSVTTDCPGKSQLPYRGPVPIVTHVHGSHVGPESDGFPEAWYLPAATNIPAGYATRGRHFDQIEDAPVEPGAAVFQYPNDQQPATLWYHDHVLGITRLNVHTGMAGFYLLRDRNSDLERKDLPQPAPSLNDPPGKHYYEIPIVIQDRSFNSDGSFFYPGHRAFFEGLEPNQLQIPFTPDPVPGNGISDVPPIWNPEFFGNTMVVNGKTWPYLEVEQRRYRLRFLNGSNSRFLILKFGTPLPFTQIGSDGGFLPDPVTLNQLLLGPAERADVMVDFSGFPAGTTITLLNLGPDEPFGGGTPAVDFDPSDPATTGKVMQFKVKETRHKDKSTPAKFLFLPALPKIGPVTNTRKVTLNEADSGVVLTTTDSSGNVIVDQDGPPFGPIIAMQGILNTANGFSIPLRWNDPITENPALNSVEIWEIYNFTADAHPIHLHQVQFEVVNRQALVMDDDGIAVQPAVLTGKSMPPEKSETGRKDTVIVYPGSVTRVKAKFDIPGLYVWHCHLLEHEDHEMMRPYCVGTLEADCPAR